jgi:hypothetical protein
MTPTEDDARGTAVRSIERARNAAQDLGDAADKIDTDSEGARRHIEHAASELVAAGHHDRAAELRARAPRMTGADARALAESVTARADKEQAGIDG